MKVRLRPRDVAQVMKIDEMCKPRLVRDPELRFDDDLLVYDLDEHSWNAMTCTAEELHRWRDARTTYLSILSKAYVAFCRAHGLGRVKVDLARGSKGWRHPTEPIHWPGWQRRLANRSRAAQERFVAETRPATQAYRPVRDEIARRLREHELAEVGRRAEEERTARERQASEQQRANVLREVARQKVWCYAIIGEADRPRVRIWRSDVEPDRAGTAALDAYDLEKALLRLHDKQERPLFWVLAARAAVERDCADRGEQITFDQWWEAIATPRWNTTTESRGPAIHASTHHTSYGVGSHGSDGSGGHGSHGGFGGHSFGGSF